MTTATWPFQTIDGLPSLALCESSSPLWRLSEEDGQPCIAILDNTDEDHDHGKTSSSATPAGPTTPSTATTPSPTT